MIPKMKKKILLTLLSAVILAVSGSNINTSCALHNECPNVKAPIALIRKRRHLSFPKGANIVLTLSLVKAFMVHAPSGWNLVLEIDVTYHLPDDEFISKDLRKKLKHRQKRQFWERLQSALDFQNMNGEACIKRGVCEARNVLAPPGHSLVHDILRAIFSVPYHHEPEAKEFAEEMPLHYHTLRDPDFCDQLFYENHCPVSILDFVLALNRKE